LIRDRGEASIELTDTGPAGTDCCIAALLIEIRIAPA
jgi:hypothetical protein